MIYCGRTYATWTLNIWSPSLSTSTYILLNTMQNMWVKFLHCGRNNSFLYTTLITQTFFDRKSAYAIIWVRLKCVTESLDLKSLLIYWRFHIFQPFWENGTLSLTCKLKRNSHKTKTLLTGCDISRSADKMKSLNFKLSRVDICFTFW